jgi:hypothetical protein
MFVDVCQGLSMLVSGDAVGWDMFCLVCGNIVRYVTLHELNEVTQWFRSSSHSLSSRSSEALHITIERANFP